jgi:hypothetical protein
MGSSNKPGRVSAAAVLFAALFTLVHIRLETIRSGIR